MLEKNRYGAMNTPHEHAMMLQELVLFRMTSFLCKQTIEQRKIYILCRLCLYPFKLRFRCDWYNHILHGFYRDLFKRPRQCLRDYQRVQRAI